MFTAAYTLKNAKSAEFLLMRRQEKTIEEEEEERKLRWEIEKKFLKSTFSHIRRKNAH